MRTRLGMGRSLRNRSGLAPKRGPGFPVHNAFFSIARGCLQFHVGIIAGWGRFRMNRKRKLISEGATIEEVQALLLKVTRQLRTMAPPPDAEKNLDQTEAWLELIMARCIGEIILH